MEIYRQGDVLLIKVSGSSKDVPVGAKKRAVESGNRVVLEYGEVTGHAHALYPEVIVKDKVERRDAPPAALWDAGAERFLQVMEKTALRHEEHAPIDLDPGVYKVVRQREYDDAEAARQRWIAD